MHDEEPEPLTRRRLLQWSGTAGVLAVSAVVLDACAPTQPAITTSTTSTSTTTSSTVPLSLDANGLLLKPGFSSRIIARATEEIAGTGFTYRWYPDGAATFLDNAVAGGWYLNINHEASPGGVTSIRFAPDGSVVGATSACDGTTYNCAGGATPWGTWLSCEEYGSGRVWECDPAGATPAVPRDAMGRFSHEAAAVAADGRVYLTEDQWGGGFYRFTPDSPEDLSSGTLEIATGAGAVGPVIWIPVPDPAATTTATRLQVPSTIGFSGGEGIDTSGNDVWFTTKYDKRVWHYRTDTQTVDLRYQGGSGVLDGLDNLLVDEASGVLFIAEDDGNQELVIIRPDNAVDAVIRVPDQPDSEITGPCFSPDGTRLYFSSQRAPVGASAAPVGVTFEVTGPWDTYLNRTGS